MIISTKIQVPFIHTALVQRYALMQRLHKGMQGKLTIVVAPAGYGKTILLSEWVKEFNVQVAWISLEKQENDFERFWSCVIAAIRKSSPGFGATLQPILANVQPTFFEPMITALLCKLGNLPDRLVLIMDDLKALVEKAKAAPEETFKDVPANAPNAKAINLGTKLGIIKGYEDGSFHANAAINRAEFATMLVKALGLTLVDDSSFEDTKGHWAAEAIATLKANGIIKGYSDGSFKPDDSISKAEIVAMLAKVMNTTSTSKSTKFNDVSGSWAEDAINTLSDSGIVKGAGDGSFKPNAKATRSESLLMILRTLNVSLGLSLDVE